MPPKTKKPFVPTEADVALADALGPRFGDLDADVIAGASVANAASALSSLVATVSKIRSEQPVILAPYFEEFAAVVRRSVRLSTEDEALLVQNLLGSMAMARVMGDVANSNVEPVAATPRNKKSAPRPSTPEGPAHPEGAETAGSNDADATTEQAPASVEAPSAPQADAPADVPAAAPAEVAKPKRTRKAAAAKPAPVEQAEPVAQPVETVSAPVAEVSVEESAVPGDFDEAVVPGDFDEPVAAVPAVADENPFEPQPVAQAPAAPAVPAPALRTNAAYTGPVGEDDF